MSSSTLTTTSWEELVAAAVLGTERRPFSAAGGGILTEFAGLDSDFMTTASVLWALRETGRRPLPATGRVLPAAPEDARPPLPGAIVAAFTALFADRRFRPVLAEWLEVAGRLGGRLPPEMVPVLLATGPEHAAAIATVAGPLGDWLAELNPDWAWLAALSPAGPEAGREWTAEALAAKWARGDEERLAALRQCRRHDPALARSFVEGIWGAEPNATRAPIVAIFAEELSLSDEPFLQLAARDRQKDARRTAISLLSSLPGSRLMADAERRATSAVRLAGRLHPRFEVREAAGLEDLVAATALQAWPARFGLPARDLVRLAGKAADKSLVRGWARAAVAQANAEWAEALFAEGAAPLGELRNLLPPALVDDAMVALAGQPARKGAMEALVPHPRPWSARLSLVFFGSLARLIAANDMTGALIVREHLASVALRADPGQLPAAESALHAIAQVAEDRRMVARSFWERRLSDMLAVLRFRQALYQEPQ